MIDDKKFDDKKRCCCCPDLGDVSGEYSHDSGVLPGQFEKTLTLAPDGTFKYSPASTSAK